MILQVLLPRVIMICFLEGKYQEVCRWCIINLIGCQKAITTNCSCNAKMFVEQQQDEHKGMVKVNVLNAKADTAHHVADVFLQVVYGDSTKEQIVVPMVEVKDAWKMR